MKPEKPPKKIKVKVKEPVKKTDEGLLPKGWTIQDVDNSFENMENG